MAKWLKNGKSENEIIEADAEVKKQLRKFCLMWLKEVIMQSENYQKI